MKKESANMKKSKEWFIRGFVGRKEKGEMIELSYNLKKIKEFLKEKLNLQKEVRK